MFVCIEGADADGHDFAGSAAEKGACAIVCSHMPAGLAGEERITVICTEDPRAAMAHMAAALYGFPAEELTLIGITGTKGKTTTAFMIAEILRKAGCKTGLIGTVCIDTGSRVMESRQTTPESADIQKYLREMADNGCGAAVMEVSSQALKLGRVEGLIFDIAVFTNLSADHIGSGEHSSLEEYIYCKSLLFRQCRAAAVNGDDPLHTVICAACRAEITTYGFRKENALRAESYAAVRMPGKLGVEFQIKGDYNIDLVLPVPGRFNCSNAMAAAAVCSRMGVKPAQIAEALRNIQIPGRQEVFPRENGGLIVVDYAHNGTALRSLLAALEEYRPKRLTCLFGCGGKRDRNRRSDMGKAACRYADFLVITSDNPRNESPQAIIRDIITEVKKHDVAYTVIPDRREAIRFAVSGCIDGEIAVIAGKGHEHEQIIGDQILHFDDREEVLASIEKVKHERDYHRKSDSSGKGKAAERK